MEDYIRFRLNFPVLRCIFIFSAILGEMCFAGLPMPACHVAAEVISFPHTEIKKDCERINKEEDLKKAKIIKSCLDKNIPYLECRREWARLADRHLISATRNIEIKVLDAPGELCDERRIGIKMKKNETLITPLHFYAFSDSFNIQIALPPNSLDT